MLKGFWLLIGCDAQLVKAVLRITLKGCLFGMIVLIIRTVAGLLGRTKEKLMGSIG